MNRSILSFCFCIILFTTKAQITITSNDMPDANDSIVLSTANNNSISYPIIADTNVIWDYSTLVPQIQMYDKYDSPMSFTTPFNLLFNILNTSYGRDNYDLTSINIPIVQLTAAYDFLKESSSSLKQIGAGYTINGAPLPFYYTSADVLYNFPLTYGDLDSCDFQFGLPIPTLGYYGQTGHRVNHVNGWGTLLTPYGSFQTVLVTSKINTIDTVYIDTLSFGTNITRPTRYEYKWLANGMKSPVLQINATVAGANLNTTNVQYIDSLRSNVPHVGITENELNNSLRAYPNPSSGSITIEYMAKQEENTSILIKDLTGRTIRSFSYQTVVGENKTRLSIDDLNAGIYFISLQLNKTSISKKIVILK
ncbi:MAG: T9SS type A sorting domain-containing protein [Bacteroidia bacterium]|nr:T9SS type A sorting domain-containing protein [Bacteroidia bacterium]